MESRREENPSSLDLSPFCHALGRFPQEMEARVLKSIKAPVKRSTIRLLWAYIRILDGQIKQEQGIERRTSAT